jgi:hypothetical protein
MKMHFYIHASKDFDRFTEDLSKRAAPFLKNAVVTFSGAEDRIITVDKITGDEVGQLIEAYRADPKFALG